MKRITIDNKEYTFEFTIEASLYDDCTKSVMDLFVKGGMVSGAATDADLDGAREYLLETIANLPQKALTLFYAGLLEHHGPEGDRSINSKADAKKLLTTYLKENNKSFKDVLGDMMGIMGDDNFFDLTGLNQIMTEVTENPKENTKAGKNTSENK